MYNPNSARTAEYRERILEVGLAHAQRVGYKNIKRADIAQEVGLKAVTIVNWAFGTMEELKRQIMVQAVQRGIVRIIADGLGHNDPVASGAAPADLAKARELLGS